MKEEAKPGKGRRNRKLPVIIGAILALAAVVAAFIFDEGSPYYSDVDNGFFIVRPAFWLDLASGVL